ncbi:MAG: hypothetical protein SGJ23_01380 [Alphaproteobacteria bacterium]|mgnify:CR=1 FL=1|nr:hypothetical protein [Alphaproteobacteria bacterium]
MATINAVDLIWEVLVERAEEMHDAVVAGQRHAKARDAGQVAALAQEITQLALTAQLLRRREGIRP